RGSQCRNCGCPRTSRSGLRRLALGDRGVEEASPHLEARALRGRHARMGRSYGSLCSGAAMTLRDQFGRSIEYLRISVTDRCNFRCSYCMQVEGLPWLPKSDILSYEEIREVVAQLAPLGLRRIRLTGGEPTIRPQIERLVRFLRDIPDIEDIALSTNGVKLP